MGEVASICNKGTKRKNIGADTDGDADGDADGVDRLYPVEGDDFLIWKRNEH